MDYSGTLCVNKERGKYTFFEILARSGPVKYGSVKKIWGPKKFRAEKGLNLENLSGQKTFWLQTLGKTNLIKEKLGKKILGKKKICKKNFG